MGKPSDQLLAAVAARGAEREDVAVRYAVVDVLNLVPPGRRNADVLRAFQASLQAKEPYLVAGALEALALDVGALLRSHVECANCSNRLRGDLTQADLAHTRHLADVRFVPG